MASAKAANEKYDKWLQCEFTADLAARLVADAKAPRASSQQAKMIKRCFHEGIFAKKIYIPEFYWGKKESPLLKGCGNVYDKSRKGASARYKVRASSQLLAVIRKVPQYTCSMFEPDPIQTLDALIRACFQESHLMCTGLWHPESLLAYCDYNLDKAFVRAVIAVSKWLGEASFPNGLFGTWPPNPPTEWMAVPSFQPV